MSYMDYMNYPPLYVRYDQLSYRYDGISDISYYYDTLDDSIMIKSISTDIINGKIVSEEFSSYIPGMKVDDNLYLLHRYYFDDVYNGCESYNIEIINRSDIQDEASLNDVVSKLKDTNYYKDCIMDVNNIKYKTENKTYNIIEPVIRYPMWLSNIVYDSKFKYKSYTYEIGYTDDDDSLNKNTVLYLTNSEDIYYFFDDILSSKSAYNMEDITEHIVIDINPAEDYRMDIRILPMKYFVSYYTSIYYYFEDIENNFYMFGCYTPAKHLLYKDYMTTYNDSVFGSDLTHEYITYKFLEKFRLF